MKIAVIGAGGVGGYFGGRLVQAGRDVWFIARGSHLDALRRDGIHLQSPQGDFSGPVRATDTPEAVGPVDLIIVGTKAWQLLEAARHMGPMIGPETIVLPLQNGVEATDVLSGVIDGRRVVGGLCRIISFIDGPGRIRHTGADPVIVFGELNREPSDRCERILDVLSGAPGMTAQIAPDIQIAIWKKFLFLAPFSGVTAATRAPMGTVRSIPESRAMVADAMREVWSLARAGGIALEDDAVETALSFIDTLPAASTTSMQRDIADGRPSELESLSGSIVRLAELRDVPAPVNRFLYHTLLPLELRARQRIDCPR